MLWEETGVPKLSTFFSSVQIRAFTERTAPKCLALTFASPAHIQSNTLSFSYILELADTGNHYNFLSGPCSADFSFLTNFQEFPPHTGMSQAVGEIPV